MELVFAVRLEAALINIFLHRGGARAVKKLVIVGITLLMLFCEIGVCCAAQFHTGDVQVINSIIRGSEIPEYGITNTMVNRFDLNDPSNWSFVTWSDQEPRRVIRLDFYAPDTAEHEEGEEFESGDGIGVVGNIVISGLEALETFNCSGFLNGVLSIDASGCTNLRSLHHASGQFQLSSLTVKGCVSLEELVVQSVELEEVDVSDCKRLKIFELH